jgi:hypothetical protein
MYIVQYCTIISRKQLAHLPPRFLIAVSYIGGLKDPAQYYGQKTIAGFYRSVIIVV